MRFSKNKTSSQSGFGVGLITALIFLIGLATVVMERQAKNKTDELSLRDDTIERLAVIETALKSFAHQNNGNLPCPAPRNISETDNLSGVSEELATGIPIVSCTGTGTGTSQINSSAGASTKLRIGAIPTKTLGLSGDLAYDFWGNRITYAIVEDFANDRAGFSATDSEKFIKILKDATDTSTLHPEVSASSDSEVGYLIISHGKNGIGAYSRTGSVISGCTAGRTQEHENCDGDATFVKREIIASNDDDASHFDDILKWGTTRNTMQGVYFGGMYSLSSSTACNDINPETGACTCPSGFSAQVFADSLNGGEHYLYYCSNTSLATPPVYFGGMYSLGSSAACNDINPETGACTCPTGFSAQVLADSLSGGEHSLYYCSNTSPATPPVYFGGMYSLGSSTACNDINPETGACTCPTGFSAHVLADSLNGGEHYLYYCSN